MAAAPEPRLAVVGAGRMGTALVAALPGAAGPFGRSFDGGGFDAVLLAVPDREITAAAAAVIPGPLVGHCAGAWGLDLLAPHEAFGMHPLMTVTRAGATFAGAGAAVAGSTPRALQYARHLAARLGMDAYEVADADRAAYHAAASIASNFLVTLEDAAEAVLATAGLDRHILLPLVRASLENWAALGGPAAITGPVARGDDAAVARQRAAVAERTPHLLGVFDAMVAATRSMARTAG
ncbi:MAG: DUF2520 domain-containing protein [Ilumatobacteraceae bacterium]|nr:DUF2520 domain-containing protein [Ilumatobacter sp.]MCB0983902.1 DUF2520 domain-containing protein [Ilumatobacter sp.]